MITSPVKLLVKKLGQAICQRLHNWFAVKPLSDSCESIAQWFNTPLGQRLLISQQQMLDQIMPKIYGYHLMQLSVLNDQTLSRQSPVTHHFSIGINELSQQQAIARFEQLPIKAESVDCVILHHALEYSTNPQKVLSEAANTIISNGYIVIVCFNPISLLRLKKQLGRCFTSTPHWRHHSLYRTRVIDWLRVLDFELANIQYGYHGLPFDRGYCNELDRFCGKLLPLLGSFYIITARKSVIPMTLIKKPWKAATNLPGWGVRDSAVSREPAAHITINHERLGYLQLVKKVELFTDGACKGNPGPGGWGVLLRYGETEKTLCGGERATTNNRMELMAAIEGLTNLKEPCHVTLTTDSQYVRQGITQWISNWKKNGWKNAAKKPVKNDDLWKRLDSESQRHTIEWKWVKGHSGHRENEIADQLANKGIP